MGKKTAGILLYRWVKNELEVLLVHPGGPFYIRKDTGVWSIPKGELEEGEEVLAAAKREFEEELGRKPSATSFLELPAVKSKSNKTVFTFAACEDFDTSVIKSNLIWIDWPPRSGECIQIPEVDKAEWFTIEIAREKILAYQLLLIEYLQKALEADQNKK